MTKQEPPFAIQLEPVEGCTLACSFCGVQSIRDNGANADTGTHGKRSAPYRFMDTAVVERIARQAHDLGWNPRWEFAMHGEPTLHKQLPEMVAAVRGGMGPKAYIMVTSNGSGLLGDSAVKVGALFDAGLNTLALDDYKHSGGWVRKVMDTLEDHGFCEVYNVPVFYYPDDKGGNPHKRHAGKMITVVRDISDNTAGTHQLTNQGGNSFAADHVNLDQRCAKPFRELSVRWDGNVALCCDDWKGMYKIGNVMDMPLEELWNHRKFEAARRKLYAAQRDFGPCEGCNVRTYRNGLLPDKLGKDSMPIVTGATLDTIRSALVGRVFTIKLKEGQ